MVKMLSMRVRRKTFWTVAVSPDIGWTVYLCGREEALARLDAALAMLPASA